MFNYRLASDTLYLVQRIHSLNINRRFSVVSCNKTWLFSSLFRVSLFFTPSRFYVSRFCVSLFCVRGFVFRYFETVAVLCFEIWVRGFVFRGFVFAVINVNPEKWVPQRLRWPAETNHDRCPSSS